MQGKLLRNEARIRAFPHPTLEDAFLDEYPLTGVKLRTIEALPGKDPDPGGSAAP